MSRQDAFMFGAALLLSTLVFAASWFAAQGVN